MEDAVTLNARHFIKMWQHLLVCNAYIWVFFVRIYMRVCKKMVIYLGIKRKYTLQKTHVYRVAGMIASIRGKKPHVYRVIILKQMADHSRNCFISRMPKMRAIPQLVSAPLNPVPIAEHFRRSHPPCEHSHGQCISEGNNAK